MGTSFPDGIDSMVMERTFERDDWRTMEFRWRVELWEIQPVLVLVEHSIRIDSWGMQSWVGACVDAAVGLVEDVIGWDAFALEPLVAFGERVFAVEVVVAAAAPMTDG